MSALDPKGLEAALAAYKRNDAYPDEAIKACIRAYLEASQGQKPGEGAAQGTPADEQSGETSPAYLTQPKGQAEAVAVKPLEWEVSFSRGYRADTPFHSKYSMHHMIPRDPWTIVHEGYGHTETLDDYPTEAEALAAAQADYETRIRSALASPTPPESPHTRPANCRFRLQDEGKSYPRSSCAACGKTISTGLGNHCTLGV